MSASLTAAGAFFSVMNLTDRVVIRLGDHI